MKNLKTLLNEAIPPLTTQQRSSGDAKMDFAFNAIQTLSKNVKFDDINKQQQFDNLVLELIRLIKD